MSSTNAPQGILHLLGEREKHKVYEGEAVPF
jgi:hypothetical protein